MAKKLKAMALGASERKLAATVRRSAKEIWYAGLGVFATTRNEGGKVYRALVKEGKRVEASTRRLAQSQFSQVRVQLSRATAAATKRATATWGGVEKNLSKRMSAVRARVSKLRAGRKPAARRRTTRRSRRAHG